MTNCQGCGTEYIAHYDGDPGVAGCPSCPPEVCDVCGGVNHMAEGRMCSCWVSIEDMPLADVKAIFAADGTFNVGADGKVTVG